MRDQAQRRARFHFTGKHLWGWAGPTDGTGQAQCDVSRGRQWEAIFGSRADTLHMTIAGWSINDRINFFTVLEARSPHKDVGRAMPLPGLWCFPAILGDLDW